MQPDSPESLRNLQSRSGQFLCLAQFQIPASPVCLDSHGTELRPREKRQTRAMKTGPQAPFPPLCVEQESKRRGRPQRHGGAGQMECQDMKQVSFLLSVKTVPSNWAARNLLHPSSQGLTLLYSILSSH